MAKQNFGTLRFEVLIGELPNLPAALEILPRLLKLLDDPQAGCDELAEMIRLDPSLTAALLRVANSARYAGAEKARSISEAIGRLGMREVYRVVLEIVTGPVLKGPDAVFGKVNLWQHSLTTAIAAQTFAVRFTQEDPEIVFTAGLLHDIGKTALVRAAREDYVHLLEQCAEHNASVVDAEKEKFGTDHTQVGARLLRKWNFPEQIAAGVSGHHSLYTLCREHERVAALVCVGNVMAYRLGVGNGYPPYVAEPNGDALRMIGLEAARLGEFNDEILGRLEEEQGRL